MNILKESIQKCLTMPNHEQSMCELKNKKKNITSLTEQVHFSPLTYLPSPGLVLSSATLFQHRRSFPAPLWVLGTSQNPQHWAWQMKHFPSKGLPAQGLCYWFRITVAVATQLNNWTGLDNMSSWDNILVLSTPAVPGLLWPTQPPQCWLGMPIFLGAKAHLTFSFA